MPADGTKPRKYIYKARKGHQREFGKWEARYRPTSKVLLNKYAKHLRNSRVSPKTGVMAHSYEFLEYFDSHSEMTAFITETREAFTQAKKVALAKKEQPTTMSTAPACPPTSDLEPEVEEQPSSWPLAPYNCEFQYSNWSDTGEELPLASSSTFPPTTSETLDGTASSLLSVPVACSADNACIMEEIDLHTLHYLEKYPTLDPTPKRANSTAQSNQLDSCGGNYADTGIFQVICEV